jgi:hypothetical protein
MWLSFVVGETNKLFKTRACVNICCFLGENIVAFFAGISSRLASLSTVEAHNLSHKVEGERVLRQTGWLKRCLQSQTWLGYFWNGENMLDAEIKKRGGWGLQN